MNPVQKALELRKSLRFSPTAPQETFNQRMANPGRILACVEQHIKDSSVLNEARRQYLVCLCAAYECYWRELIKRTVDSHELHGNNIKRLRNYKFSFSDLHQILGYRLTLGELVSNCYTFQGTDVLNQLCQEVFSFDLFSIMSRIKVTVVLNEGDKEVEERPAYLQGVQVLRSRRNIDRGFAIRHDTVHNTGARFRLTRKSLRKIGKDMHFFNWLTSHVLESEVNERCPRDKAADNASGSGVQHATLQLEHEVDQKDQNP